MPHIRTRGIRWLAAGWMLVSMPAQAGTIGLIWDAASGASGYRVYYGASSGHYTASVDVGSATQTTVTGLADCNTWYLAVKAYNAVGESPDFSNEVSGWPRPSLSVASPAAAIQGAQFTLDIRGSNFQSGATVQIDNPNVFLQSARVVSCTEIQVAATIEPTASGVRPAEIGSFALEVMNSDRVYGDQVGLFEVQVNPARFDVNKSDSTTNGRVDGEDTVAISRIFGVQESDPAYDPDDDLNGDGWIDGQDLAYIAANLGRCWTGTAWSAAACSNR